MKAAELLKRYKKGQRDFQGIDLGGQNLSGQKLSDADFSGADFTRAKIQGTNFSGTKLTGADFTKAQAGLQWYSVFCWWLTIILLPILPWILLWVQVLSPLHHSAWLTILGAVWFWVSS